MVIRVYLVEDQALVRAALSTVLCAAADIELVGEAGCGETALPEVRRLIPDVVVCDLYMPGISGMEVTERIVRSGLPTRVVIVSMLEDGPLPQRLLDLGASAYVGKSAVCEELRQAVRRAARGERYLGAGIAQKLVFAGLGAGTTPFDALSARETQVAMLLARGLRQEEAARVLGLSAKTVNSHKANLFTKLGVRDAIALARLATQYGLLDPARDLSGRAGPQPVPQRAS